MARFNFEDPDGAPRLPHASSSSTMALSRPASVGGATQRSLARSASHVSLAPTDDDVKSANAGLKQLLRKVVSAANDYQAFKGEAEAGGVLQIEETLDSVQTHYIEGHRLLQKLGSIQMTGTSLPGSQPGNSSGGMQDAPADTMSCPKGGLRETGLNSTHAPTGTKKSHFVQPCLRADHPTPTLRGAGSPVAQSHESSMDSASIEKVEDLLKKCAEDAKSVLRLQSFRVQHHLTSQIAKFKVKIVQLQADHKDLDEKKRSLLKRQKNLARRQTRTLQSKCLSNNEHGSLSLIQNCFSHGREYLGDVNTGPVGEPVEIHEKMHLSNGMTRALASLRRKNRALKQSADNELRHRRMYIDRLKRLLQLMMQQNLQQKQPSEILNSNAGTEDPEEESSGAAFHGGKKIRVEDIAWYQVVSGMDAPESALEFLTYLSVTDGLFPFDYLENLERVEYRCSLELLCVEFASLRLRMAGLEQVFGSLEQLRSKETIAAAVQSISSLVMSLLNCDRASYWMVETEEGLYAWTKVQDTSSSARPDGARELRVPMDSGLVGHSVTSKNVLNIADAYKDYRFSQQVDKASGYHTQSVVCVPIKVHGEVMAVVQAINKKDDDGVIQRFDEQDVFLLYVLGYTMTDVVIECEKHELDVQTYKRKDRLIAATGDLFLHCRCTEDMMRLLKEYMAELFQSREVALILLGGDHVTRLTIDGVGRVQELDCPKDKGLCGVCIETKSSIHIQQIAEDTTYDDEVDLPVEEGSFHVWPLYRGRQLTAILEWNCAPRDHVDFGDDGCFNRHNPQHDELLGKLMSIMQLYIEQWYPTTERLQSALAQKVKTKLRATVRVSMQRKQLAGMVVRSARLTAWSGKQSQEAT